MEDPLSNRYAGIYYDPKEPENLREFESRQLFLRAAARAVPNLADALFEATVPIIAAWLKRGGPKPTSGSEAYTEFRSSMVAAIVAWAKSFNILTNWVVREAHDTVYVGINYAQKGIDVLEAFGTWRRGATSDSKQEFQLPAWVPYLESERNYIRRANREWKKLRDEHVAAKTDELQRSGAIPVPPRRKRKFDADQRFEWAALHRCAGMSIEELADKYGEETETIRISVSRILKELGFEPT